MVPPLPYEESGFGVAAETAGKLAVIVDILSVSVAEPAAQLTAGNTAEVLQETIGHHMTPDELDTFHPTRMAESSPQSL
jgi:hypothetical protein